MGKPKICHAELFINLTRSLLSTTMTPDCNRLMTWSFSCAMLARSTPRCSASSSVSRIRLDNTYDNKAVAKPVKLGISDDTHFEVLSGLEEGDLVVTGPFRLLSKTLKDGDLVLKGALKICAYDEETGNPPTDWDTCRHLLPDCS